MATPRCHWAPAEGEVAIVLLVCWGGEGGNQSGHLPCPQGPLGFVGEGPWAKGRPTCEESLVDAPWVH